MTFSKLTDCRFKLSATRASSFIRGSESRAQVSAALCLRLLVYSVMLWLHDILGSTQYNIDVPVPPSHMFLLALVPPFPSLLLRIYSVLRLQSAAMGIDAGFDMNPPLSRGVIDKHNWDTFIGFVKEHYKDDDQVEIKPNYINFKAGEHPKLPFEGHKFLRFSSKVSGSIARSSGVERYIDTVTRIAQAHFGSRVQYWNEGSDQHGVYDWNRVNESVRSYEQVRYTYPPLPLSTTLNNPRTAG